ncbi:hypothetical protein C6A85_11005, partial [Mycobacterium sp. ITM-2017-0098]
APNSEDAVVVADGYQQGVVISWGDPVLSDAPKFDVTKQTGAAEDEVVGAGWEVLEQAARAEPAPTASTATPPACRIERRD